MVGSGSLSTLKGTKMKPLLSILPVSAALLAFLSVLPAAHAQAPDPLLLTFTAPDQTTGPGSILHFTGLLTNASGSAVFLNGDSLTFSAPVAGLTLDDSSFNNNAPTLLTAGPPGNFYTGSFFDVMVSPSVAPGTYQGTFDVSGGADGTASGEVASAPFTVTVAAPNVSAAPEPSPLAGLGLTALGVAGLALKARRKKAQSD